MLHDSALADILTLAVVTLVLLVDLRSFVDTFLVLTPLLAALAWVTGFMYVFDIKLNLYNMVAFPTIIGMGIDNGVHIFHRYRETGKGSLRLVLRTTGMALLATSLTTMVGFSGLVPAIHPALTSIGVLSLVGLGSCFIASVTLLPAPSFASHCHCEIFRIMFQRLAALVVRFWPAFLAAWLVLLVVSSWAAPDLNDVANSGEFAFLPQDAPSRVSERLFQESWDDSLASRVVIVASCRDPKDQLTEEDKRFIDEILGPQLEQIAVDLGGLADSDEEKEDDFDFDESTLKKRFPKIIAVALQEDEGDGVDEEEKEESASVSESNHNVRNQEVEQKEESATVSESNHNVQNQGVEQKEESANGSSSNHNGRNQGNDSMLNRIRRLSEPSASSVSSTRLRNRCSNRHSFISQIDENTLIRWNGSKNNPVPKTDTGSLFIN